MFTVVVVLPTPPFWLATTMVRVLAGRGSGCWLRVIAATAASASRAIGVSSAGARRPPCSVSVSTAAGTGCSAPDPIGWS